MRIVFVLCALASVAHADPPPNLGDVELRAMVSATHTSVDTDSGTGYGVGISLAKRVASDTFVGLQANFASYTDDQTQQHQLLQLHAIVEVQLAPVTIGLGLGFDHYVVEYSDDYGTQDGEWMVGAHVQLTVPIVRQGSSTVELLLGAGVSPIIDVPGFSHGEPADVVTSASVGIAYRFL